MSNPNERTTQNREVRQEFYNDASGNTYSNVTRTSETVNNSTANQSNSYSDGYVQGKVSERRYQENVLAERDNNNAARGLVLGIIFTSVAALAVGYTWFINQKNDSPTSVTPTVIVPNSPPDNKPKPEVERPPQKETIIERTKELVPVPQQVPSPTPKQDINITVPNSAPQQPEKQTPTTQTPTTPPQNQSSNTDSQAQKTDTDATTPANSTSDPTDKTSDSTSTDTNNTNNSAQ